MIWDKCQSGFAYEPVEGDEWLPMVAIVVARQTNFFESVTRGRERIALKLVCCFALNGPTIMSAWQKQKSIGLVESI
jgi:hypothetical protein